MNYWDRPTLKTRAKGVLKSSYWMSFLANILVGVMGGIVASIAMLPGTLIFGSAFAFEVWKGNGEITPQMTWPMILWYIFALAIAFAAAAFFANILEVGSARFYTSARKGKISIDELFYGFKNGYYMNNVKIMFKRMLFIFLWGLIPLAGPFIAFAKGYSYFMIPYILAENPGISSDRAFEISKQTTNGEKWNMFVLDLSFIGWYLLGALACGVGQIFVPPYHYATRAELYGALQYKAIQTGVGTEDEVGSIIQPQTTQTQP